MKEESEGIFNQLNERNHRLEEEISSIDQFGKDRIEHVSEFVYQRVSQTLNDQIKR